MRTVERLLPVGRRTILARNGIERELFFLFGHGAAQTTYRLAEAAFLYVSIAVV